MADIYKEKWSTAEWHAFLQKTLCETHTTSDNELSANLKELKDRSIEPPYVEEVYTIIRYRQVNPIKLAIFFQYFPPTTLLTYPNIPFIPYSKASGLFHAAARSENPKKIEIVQMLLDMGLDLNWLCDKYDTSRYEGHLRDNFRPEDAGVTYRETALHVAAARGDKELVRYLLGHGADISSKDGFDYTPKKRAEVNQQEETAEMFG
jgi:hypothetical protein